ncbi:Flagellar protein FliS [Acididesulfobacillus acetoxydans]|uniref:Flagellar protein FliS n=1 Tax=Acididesulfobacillus acetoxydans TaxID=1561005 RepID=A0A8S0X1J3_9FIRM|nr:Flagellar protein FliS [Acididesulfobacillus acetoxydans]CEJ07591.1 Flagellar protein FliS [Acididesulfobacillus acetoxydans]
MNTATPERLLVMLYDGLLRFMSEAGLALKDRQYEQAHRALIRAQEIVLELRSTLKREIAPELADSLHSLYTFFYEKLIEANRTKTLQPLAEITGMVTELRNSFQQAEQKVLAAKEGRECV